MDQENQTDSTPPPQPIPTGSSENPKPTDSKKKLNILHILVGVGIGMLFLAGGFFLYQYLYPITPVETTDNTSKTATQSAKETPTPVPAGNKDETEDWKTYTSSKDGFSLKYPKDWLDNACEEELAFLSPTKGTLGICQSEFGGMVNIGYTPDFKYEDYISQQPFVDLSSLNNGKREETTVAGKRAIKISGTYKEDSFTLKKDAQKILYLIEHKNGFLSINYYSEPAWGDYSKTFEQIISTLKPL